MTSSHKPTILLMGQTPPPWHGQAVATQILFDAEWDGFDVHLLRMEYSEDMIEVGRFSFKKLLHLFDLVGRARKILKDNPGCVLFYPPTSAKWVPFLRDALFLTCVRPLAGATVFIYHASGLPVFTERNPFSRLLARLAYRDADVSLEVAQEALPPHEIYGAKRWQWCPCAIEVPLFDRTPTDRVPFTILFMGSLQEGKGVLELLRTAAALKERGREAEFRFRVVGKWFSEDFRKEALALSSSLGVTEMVDFPGQLTGDDKWEAYAEADVFFFPTHYSSEASPIVLMEAVGAGLPIISTRWAGIPAMLEGCMSARLLPIRSPSIYAEALLDLLAGKGRQSGVPEVARAFYLDHFLPQKFVQRVSDAFKSIPTGKDFEKYRGIAAEEPVPRSSEPNTPLRISAYLADQNPGYDRSFGISRMTQVVLRALHERPDFEIQAVTSKTSQQAPASFKSVRVLPWGTRTRLIRLLTDHLHPLFTPRNLAPDVYYYPKGYLPLMNRFCHPSVVTIHDTIIQYDKDRYPAWRTACEYAYWAHILKHTIRRTTRILTVSESSKTQIENFSRRHGLPKKEITVTYEPCAYEPIPQPREPQKDGFVMHLASSEPHKRTAQLIRWWVEEEKSGNASLPPLHLIGTIPSEVVALVESAKTIVVREFLTDEELQKTYSSALALILPSEIEGFGLPALEAYYLGTPVCYVQGTSVEEILGVATAKGGFSLESRRSLFQALEDVVAIPPAEVHAHGMVLREAYSVEKVITRITKAFLEVAEGNRNRA
jgi:glycosyltransferase involved in cell wall biosynthesis